MSNISVEVNIAEAMGMLGRADRAISTFNLATILEGPVEEYMQQRAEVRFGQEGDDASGKWLELTQATKSIRRKKGYPESPINVRTGEMRNWVTHAEGQLVLFGEDLALLWPGEEPMGELADKIMHAQAGDRETRTPPRPVIAANETDLAAIAVVIGSELQQDLGMV